MIGLWKTIESTNLLIHCKKLYNNRLIKNGLFFAVSVNQLNKYKMKLDVNSFAQKTI